MRQTIDPAQYPQVLRIVEESEVVLGDQLDMVSLVDDVQVDGHGHDGDEDHYNELDAPANHEC